MCLTYKQIVFDTLLSTLRNYSSSFHLTTMFLFLGTHLFAVSFHFCSLFAFYWAPHFAHLTQTSEFFVRRNDLNGYSGDLHRLFEPTIDGRKKVKAINAACLLRHKSRKTIETWYFTCCAFRRCYIRVFRTFRMHTYAVRRQSFFHSLIILTLSQLISMCAFFGSFSLHFYEILASDNCERFCFFQKTKIDDDNIRRPTKVCHFVAVDLPFFASR